MSKNFTTNFASIPASYTTYFSIVITISSLSIICHIVGLVCIHLYKKKTNQNIVLTFLSCCDIGQPVYTILSECLLEPAIKGKLDPQTVVVASESFWLVTVYALLFAYFILTLDRMICAQNPLKYKIRMSRCKLQVMVVASLISSIVIGLVIGTAKESIRIWMNAVGLVVAVAVAILSIKTYYMIIVAIKNSRESFPRTRAQNSKLLKKEFLVPTILISTYIGLYIIPYLVLNFYPWAEKDELKRRLVSTKYCVIWIFPTIGNLADAITYIFLVKHYRDTLVNIFRRSTYNMSTTDLSTVSRSNGITSTPHELTVIPDYNAQDE